MPLAQDTTAWTEIGVKAVTPSYYAFVNGTFVNLNAPGGSALLSFDQSVGVKKSQFIPKKGTIDLGNTDPLPTIKQPSEFNCALGVGVLLGFQKALDEAAAEHEKVLQTQSGSIAEEDVRACVSALIRAMARASVTLVATVEQKTISAAANRREKIHGYSRR